MQDATEQLRLRNEWMDNPRWKGLSRPYSVDEVVRLRPRQQENHVFAYQGAERLWNLLHRTPGKAVRALGAMSGMEAIQHVRAGLEAIYVSGWQVAANANANGEVYPDQSLYDASSVPRLVHAINNALQRQDAIEHAEGNFSKDWYVPLIADADAGFGGNLNAYELMRHMIEAGAAAVHFEDQLSSEKKCGHLGGKVLVPTKNFIRTLVAARLAADVCNVPTLIIARTDALSAALLTADIDERDKPFLTGERTEEGFYRLQGTGLERAIARGVAYAPYADLLWCETSTPNVEEARQFAEGIHKHFPGKLLAYNCSPSFHWKKHLDEATLGKFQDELAAMGYAFQFVTLAGFHALNTGVFELASAYRERGMAAYSALQQQEFALESEGYTATRHQHEVGTSYFDEISRVISQGESSTLAMKGSTEEEQF